MSDVSQGPGWWQATDDKWYPPEDHPDYPANLAVAAEPAAPAADPAQFAEAPQAQQASAEATVAAATDDDPPPTPVSTTAIGFGSVPGTPVALIPGNNITLPPPMPAPGGMATPQPQHLGKPPSQISLAFHSEMYLGAGTGGGGVSQARSQIRRHSTMIVIVLIVALLAAGGVGYYLTKSKNNTTAPVNPALARSAPYLEMLKASAEAANASGSVHVVGTGNLGTGAGSSESGDIGPNGTSIQAQSPDNGSFQMIISGGTPYALGDVTFLESAGFDAMSASQYQGQWLVFPTSIPGIQAAFKNFTFKSLVDPYLSLAGVVTETQSTVGGAPVINLTGQVPGTSGPGTPNGTPETISLTAAAPHLPVQVVITGANGGTVSFTNWGEAVNPAPPANPVNVVNVITDAQ